MVNQRRSLGLVNDLAGLDDVDAVGNRERAIEILFDQQDRKPVLLELGDDALEMLDHDGSKAFRRFIHQDEFGIDHQCASDSEHLSFTARELIAPMLASL